MINDDILKIKDTIVNTVPTEKIYLFGSYASGTPGEDSDYDFYVVISDGSMRPIEAMQAIYRSLKRPLKRPVDVLAGTTEIFERRSKQVTLERKIAREGVVLYARE